MRPDIKVWNPENPAQWNKTLAWTTVWLSTFSPGPTRNINKKIE